MSKPEKNNLDGRPVNQPGDLYYEDKKENRRSEPCRLKSPDPGRKRFVQLIKHTFTVVFLMLICLFLTIHIVHFAAKLKRARRGAAPAVAVREENTAAETETEPAVAETEIQHFIAILDLDLMKEAVRLTRKADSLYKEEKISEAQEIYSRALELWPDAAETLTGLGHLYLNRGDNTRAHDLLTRAAVCIPGNVQILNDLGRLKLLTMDYEQAAEYFKTAMELDPEYIDSYLNMGRNNLSMGYVSRAREQIQKGLLHQPGDSRALRFLAYIEALEGNYEKALSILTQAIQKAPDALTLHIEAAATCALMGDIPQSLAYLEKTVALSSPERIYWIYGEPVFVAVRNTEEGRLFGKKLADSAAIMNEDSGVIEKAADTRPAETNFLQHAVSAQEK